MILVILQARMSSTRLPGKVLKPILGEPMLVRQIERVLSAQSAVKLLIATSADNSDDPIVTLAKATGVDYFRGSLEDVLARFYYAAKNYEPQNVVRVTGDCPLLDPEVLDNVINYHLSGDFDYTSNVLPPSFPDGLDVEVMKFSALETAYKEAVLPSHREHVTMFINRNPKRFKLGNFKNTEDLSQLRWTVDEKEDLEFVRYIYKGLYEKNNRFLLQDILGFLRSNPNLNSLNKKYQRNTGLIKSLQKDREFLQKKGT